MSSLDQASGELNAAESARRGYILIHDSSLLIDYDVALQTMVMRLDRVEALVQDNPSQQQRIRELKAFIPGRLELLRQSVDLERTNPLAEEQQRDLTRQGVSLDDKIFALFGEMKAEEARLLQKRSKVSLITQHRATTVFVLTFLLASMALVSLFLLMTSEVARRARAEAVANDNEEKFRLLVSGIRDYAIFRLDLDGRITTWNSGAERLFGYHALEALGKPLSHLFQACDQQTPEQHLRIALQEGHIQDECQQLRNDGTVFWATADVTLLRDEENEPRGYAVITRDITERREQREAIKHREEQLNAFFLNAPVGLAIIDKDLHLQRINEPFSRLNGLDSSENIGLHVRDVVQSLATEIEPVIRQVLNTGTPVLNYEVRGHAETNSGGVGWWLKSFFPILTEAGTVTQIGAVVQDVTGLKRAENAVRWLSGRLLQLRDDERRRLARDLHDSLGQTLTAIKMNLSYVARDTSQMDERGRNAVAESLELIDSSLKEVRTISHLLHPPMLDEVGLLPAVRWYATGFAQRSGIDVQLDLPQSLRRLPSELEIAVFRVIQESLTNVHRHSGSTTAAIRLEVDSGRIQLQVIDHGRGIPSQKLSFRSENDTIGVGILGMRERLRQLHGRMDITSTEGQGTNVRVIIPLNEGI
jgi:PAS domain S-box-containing protein